MYKTAQQRLQKLIDLKPTRANLHNDLGVARVKAGDLYGARASFERALELDPDNQNFRDSYNELANGQ